CIDALSLERLAVGQSGRWQDTSKGSATLAVLGRKPRCCEEGSTVASIPKHARSNNTARVAGEISPVVVVDISDLLPVPTSQHGECPSTLRRRRIPRHNIG